MKRVGIIGHFGYGKVCLDGQTIKTHTLTDALQNELTKAEVCTLDTHGGLKNIFKMVLATFKMFLKCKNIIMLPAHKGLKLFIPLLRCYNCFFHRKIHYSVIGGWLPQYVKKHRFLGKLLRGFDFIYVETHAMRADLEKLNFGNIVVVPNFKNIKILSDEDLIFEHSKPFKFCTFSRVSAQKGIEDAIDAVKAINTESGETMCTLDIYGRVDADYQLRFSQLQSDFPEYVRYCGCIDANDSVDVLKNYYALLFPTHSKTEGVPGTIIDALCSGVPTIAKEWNSADEVVLKDETGIIYPNGNCLNLYDALSFIIDNKNIVFSMKRSCLSFAEKFSMKNAIGIIISKLA